MRKTIMPTKLQLRDAQGNSYERVREEREITPGISEIALWERIQPLDQIHWFRLTLRSATAWSERRQAGLDDAGFVADFVQLDR